MTDQKPYLCPVCKGRQVVSNEFYVGRSKTFAEESREADIQMKSIWATVGFGEAEKKVQIYQLTDEEQEEARILHSDVECRTCGGKGVVIV